MSNLPSSHRIDWIDSMKGFLAFLVCLGHGISFSCVDAAHPFMEGYFWISSFHMPAFFVVAGLLVKQEIPAPFFSSWFRNSMRRTINLAVPTMLIMGISAPVYLYNGWDLPST